MKYKYQLNIFNDFDCRSVKTKLNKMNSEGWKLIDGAGYIWQYKRCEPNSIKYDAVVREVFEYTDDRDDFDKYFMPTKSFGIVFY